ncbi:MAG: ATP synthase F0 subunit C [Deltaproteobacteria bacterium]|nr:ATP synthase F0 subunit C [Deltaproteobacteria bacterium]
MSYIVRIVVLVLGMIVVASPSFAAEGTAADASGLIALGAGLGIGIAALGVGLGQGRATAAAMESIGRNPNSADRIFVPMIIGLALMEALCLYALVIAFFLQGKIG